MATRTAAAIGANAAGRGDQYGAATEQYDTAMENYDEACSLAGQIKTFVASPVLGGIFWRTLYQIMAIGVVVFFGITVAEVAPTWTEKVSTAETEFQEKIAYPDVYMCLSGEDLAFFIKATTDPTDKRMMRGKDTGDYNYLRFKSGVGGESDKFCGAYGLSVFNLRTRKPSDFCPMDALGMSDNWVTISADGKPQWGIGTFKDRINFESFYGTHGTRTGDADPTTYTRVDPTFKADKMAGELAGMMPNYTTTNPNTGQQETIPGFCFRVIMKSDANSYYTNASDAALSMTTRIQPIEALEDNTPIWNFYITEQGVAPYDVIAGQKNINASFIAMPGAATTTKLDLTLTKFKDETEPFNDKEFKHQYTSSGLFQAQKEFSYKNADGSYKNYIGADFLISFLHFSRKVHIRNKTFSEIWSEIGGLWAAAALLLGLFFTNSGATDANKKPAVIFAFLPDKYRRKFIAQAKSQNASSGGGGAKPKETGTNGGENNMDASNVA